MIRTLGLASDALVMDGLSAFENHGDHVIQRTPSEPTFWFGNQLIIADADAKADVVLPRFARAFPDSAHIVVTWDLADMDPARLDPGFAAAGCEVDVSDVLRLDGMIADATLPDGVTIRPLNGDDDWAQALSLQLACGKEEGRDPAVYHEYAMGRNDNRRAHIPRG